MMPVFAEPSAASGKTTSIDLSGEISPTTHQSTEKLDDPEEGVTGGMGAWLPSATAMLLPTTEGKAGEARQWIADRRQGMRSWRTFVQTSKFKIPTNPLMAGQRIVRNVEHFQSNYAVIFVVLCLYCVLTSPMLLFALAACAALGWLVRSRANQGRLKIAGKDLPLTYQYGIIAALSFPLFYIAGAGSTIFWVIGASIVLILVHALAFASEPVPGAEFDADIETV